MGRKILKSLILILLITIFGYSYIYGQIRQGGYVTIQNSGKSPLSGVQVRAAGAIPASSDIKGNFTLSFGTSKAGELLLLEDVYKEGYELVNRRELERWALSPSRTVPIVMCPEGTLLAAQEKYYEIGKTHNIERYANTCKMLDEQLVKNQITIDEYNSQLDRISKEYQHTMEQLEAYAYNMACYNRDDLDKMSQNALSLVESGQIEKAIALYANVRLTDHFIALGMKEGVAGKELEAMIPSLRLNADVCLFAGGEKNIIQADKIYESIAMSDTTNAVYASEYAEFLVGIRSDLDKAFIWNQRALRHSSDSLQRAELYSGLGMLNTYFNKQEEAWKLLNKAKSIYNVLQKHDRYKEDAYFNISCVINFINEGRYWMMKKNNIEAFNVLHGAFEYAYKAVNVNPSEYAYYFAFLAQEFATAVSESMVQYNLRKDEDLQFVLNFCTVAIDALNDVEKKYLLKAASLKTSLYYLMAVASFNCGRIDLGEQYIDSCNILIDKYMDKNPVWFTNHKYSIAYLMGGMYISQNEYYKAFDLLHKTLKSVENLRYEERKQLQILHQMSLCTMHMLEEKDNETVINCTTAALKLLHRYPNYLLNKHKMEILYAYIYARILQNTELEEMEQSFIELIDFVIKNDKERKWFTETYMENVVSFVIYMYDEKTVTNKLSKLMVINGMIKLIDCYPQYKDSKLNKVIMISLCEQDGQKKK